MSGSSIPSNNIVTSQPDQKWAISRTITYTPPPHFFRSIDQVHTWTEYTYMDISQPNAKKILEYLPYVAH